MPESQNVLVRRVLRYGTVPMVIPTNDYKPPIGPEDRDWFTIEIDIIPPVEHPDITSPVPASYTASVINRRTGESAYYLVVPEDYDDLYSHDPTKEPNPHGHTREDLVVGEAIGTLFATLRDEFDQVVNSDPQEAQE